jgi:TusA-related sulfurtransferase
MNFVKVKLKLEEIEEGEKLELWLDDGEAIKNVPRSLKDEGHEILEVEKGESYFKLVVRKGSGY